MNKFFLIQLIVSFVVGGTVIALLSFIAEKANKRIAGIILAFPTTVALGFFFLGWTLSSNTVADVVPATLIPLGLSVLFVAVYVRIAEYSARIIRSKVWQIIVSFTLSIGLWFVLAIPFVILKINHLGIGVAGYLLLICIAHLLLQRKNHEKAVSLTYSVGQKISRAIFVGFIVFLVVLLGKLSNPFWGGMFAVFPAAFSSVLIILHWYHDPKSLSPTMQKVAIGSLSLFAYALTTIVVFPRFGFIVGTIFAYAVSLAVTLGLMTFESKSSIFLTKRTNN
ncbi:hypothetical protein IPJ72_02475 [Candidatus Peregrinibacteria bacterium]|nr:MAG: hypothetical protein IPJ72_02475 [Candidatus Peregrinibacteria bacterium]